VTPSTVSFPPLPAPTPTTRRASRSDKSAPPPALPKSPPFCPPPKELLAIDVQRWNSRRGVSGEGGAGTRSAGRACRRSYRWDGTRESLTQHLLDVRCGISLPPPHFFLDNPSILQPSPSQTTREQDHSRQISGQEMQTMLAASGLVFSLQTVMQLINLHSQRWGGCTS
jgi:hypothetical protein